MTNPANEVESLFDDSLDDATHAVAEAFKWLVGDNPEALDEINEALRPVMLKFNTEWPVSDWQYEVANGDTRRGYDDWYAAMREQASEETS